MRLSHHILAQVRGPLLAVVASGCALTPLESVAPAEDRLPAMAMATAPEAVAALDLVAYDPGGEASRLTDRDQVALREDDRRERRLRELRRAQTPPPTPPSHQYYMVRCGRG